MEKIKDMTDWEKEYQERERIRKQEASEYLLGLREILMKEGFKSIVVHYEGCGDSGEAYDAEGFKDISEDDDRKCGHEYVDKYDFDSNNHKQIPVDEWKCTRFQHIIHKIESDYNKTVGHKNEMIYLLTDMVDYDWYNNEGGSGKVIWRLEENKLEVDGCQYYRAEEPMTDIIDLNEIV
jgi:hypothetical protein